MHRFVSVKLAGFGDFSYLLGLQALIILLGGTNLLEQIRQKLSELNCQAFVSTNRISRRYLTKFTGSAGLVWIDQINQILITDFRYTEQATEQAVGWQVLEDNNFRDRVAALIKEHNITRLAFESEFITVAEYQTCQSKLGVDLVSTENFILDFRMVKTPERNSIY